MRLMRVVLSAVSLPVYRFSLRDGFKGAALRSCVTGGLKPVTQDGLIECYEELKIMQNGKITRFAMQMTHDNRTDMHGI